MESKEKLIIPPIKSQGIKTKLVPWINELIDNSGIINDETRWFEPFMGTGVVCLNAPACKSYICSDVNKHLVRLYLDIQTGEINPQNTREYLEEQSVLLAEGGDVFYRSVRERFNNSPNSLDFIFLSRSCFNGMMRFNSKGKWNVPFCKKPERFGKAYITKIVNQADRAGKRIASRDYMFITSDFRRCIKLATENDIIYCDPPYFGRSTDYYQSWNEVDEHDLAVMLQNTKAKFVLSTWVRNEYRENPYIKEYWSGYNICTHEHFYHNGGKIENRHGVTEGLIYNF